MAKTIEIKCEGAGKASLDDLIIIQGKFKTLSKTSAEKLKASILQEGFADPIRIWISGGKTKKMNIIDGAQRITVLKQMREGGYLIPALPVDYIKAQTKKEAIRKIVALSSQFGDISIVGLDELIKSGQVQIAEIQPISWFMVAREYDLDLLQAEINTVSEKELGILETTNKCPKCGYEW